MTITALPIETISIASLPLADSTDSLLFLTSSGSRVPRSFFDDLFATQDSVTVVSASVSALQTQVDNLVVSGGGVTDYNQLTNLPDLSVYALQTDLTPLASTAYVDAQIASIPASFSGQYGDLTGAPDLSVYVTGAELTTALTPYATITQLNSAIAALPSPFSGNYADLSGSPDLSSLLTALQPADLLPYATTTYVDSEIASAVIDSGGFTGSYNDLTDVPTDIVVDADLAAYVTGASLSMTLASYATTTYVDANVFDGQYSSLTGTPDLSTFLVTTDLNPYSTTAQMNAAISAAVFSGNYNDLTNQPTLFSGSYLDLTNIPTNLATTQFVNAVVFSGNYNDLTNLPTLFDGAYASLTGTPDLSVYALASDLSTNYVSNASLSMTLGSYATTAYVDGAVFSGAYGDLTGLPTLFDGQYSSLAGTPTLGTAAATNSDAYVSSSGGVSNIQDITQTAYDALTPPLDGVLYVITGA